MGGKLYRIWEFVRNHKYLGVTLLFLLVIGVVDENSVLSRYHNVKQIREMRSEIRKYKEQYDYDTERLNEINEHSEAVKKLAREKYYMKTDNEDLFVIIREQDEETE